MSLSSRTSRLPRAPRLHTIRWFTTTPPRRVPASTEDGEDSHPKPLFGTAPPHRAYIFLHSADPPASFPPRISTPLQRALQLKALRWGGLVNFAWYGPDEPSSSPSTSTIEHTSATAFSTSGGRLHIPSLTLENLDEVEEQLRNYAEGPVAQETSDEIHLYVCTHGSRDCRCGDTGGAVARALREELARRRKEDPSGIASRVRFAEVGHVGGHEYAANLLVYPHGEWLGRLEPGDVPAVLSEILDSPIRSFGPEDRPLSPLHWRGRMGLSKLEQLELFASASRA
ncbi:putative sucrase/ferredoxin-like [Lyophyllum shimeji]|uniref:Sucrase/ferredoxin-like n=1 Tax=Lyophyllum shimeji TaxID=47721 RepID=A0A9P3PRY8_LYOSH|nr:putative sucrase/ferredoxin-like [Lyophyllum shimeji]